MSFMLILVSFSSKNRFCYFLSHVLLVDHHCNLHNFFLKTGFLSTFNVLIKRSAKIVLLDVYLLYLSILLLIRKAVIILFTTFFPSSVSIRLGLRLDFGTLLENSFFLYNFENYYFKNVILMIFYENDLS